MNKKTIQTILAAVMAVLASPSFLFSQEGEALKWGGYVKVDMFNDSRAVVGVRDDLLALYPAERRQITSAPAALTAIAGTDAANLYVLANKEDLNAVRQTSITTIETRMNLTINAPDAFGAKVKGLIEADFFGASNSDIFNFYLRHANVTFDWGSSKLLVGQWWHPLFTVGYQALTVQFSPLIIIHPFNRSPQIAYTQNLGGGLSLTVAALYQAYHASSGPADTTNCTVNVPSGGGNNIPVSCSTIVGSSVTTSDAYGSRFKRWADKPDIDLQLIYKSDMFDIGLTLDFNEVRPYDNRPVYDNTTPAALVGNNKNNVNGFTKQIFGKFVFDKDNNGHIRFAYLQGENTFHLVMLGGYAQKGNLVLDNLTALGISTAEANLIRAFTKKEYIPIQVVSYWIQPVWGKDIEYAIALGKVENKGAKEDVKTFYSRGANIKSVTHVIPQVKFKSGKTEIGVMLGYFEAEYMEDDKGYKQVTQYINTQAGIAGPTYDRITIGGFTIPNPAVRDSKGVIGDSYKVVDYRLQASVKQNF